MAQAAFPVADSLREAIIRTIAFFDMFDYPLTPYEVWHNLDWRWPLPEIIRELSREAQGPAAGQKMIGEKNGFYFLRGREDILTIRQKRHNYSARKIKIARRFARAFSLCPWVKVVALANSLGFYNLRDESDIDFFIITAPGRIWLSRLYCTGLAKLLKRRPTAAAKRDTVCLSFYVAEDYGDLDDLKLADADPYFHYWRRQLILLYNKDTAYEKFLTRAAAEPNVPDFWERAAKRWQLRILPPELKAAANNSDGVVINDRVLKFYRRDRRREYAEKYGQKIQALFAEND